MTKKPSKNKVQTAAKALSEAELQRLAHAGTAEAVARIEKYMNAEQDSEKRAYAQMALEEGEFFYFQPRDDKEEAEFILCKLISLREARIMNLEGVIQRAKSEIEKLLLEKKIHDKVLAANKAKREDWQYRWLGDFVVMEERKLKEAEDDLAYETAWVKEAKKSISTPRYKRMSARHLEHFDFGFDGDDGDCCEEGCGCDDCETC